MPDHLGPLAARAARYGAVFEHARDAMLLVDDEGRYLDVNPAACELLGYSCEELLALTIWDVTPPERVEEGRALWRAFTAGGHLAGDYLLRRRDGSTVPTEFSAVAHVQPGVHLTIMRDVSARLRDAERFRQVVENISDIVTVLDEQGTILYESPSATTVLGWRPEELVGRNAFDFVHPEDRAAVLAAFDLGRPQFAAGRFRFRHRDGSWRMLEAAGRAQDGDGERRTAVVASRDVTAREQAEEALRSTQALLDSVLTSIPMVLFAIDGGGVFTFSEGRALQDLGLAPGQAVGLSAFELYRDSPTIVRNLRRALAGETFTGVLDEGGRSYQAWYSPRRETDGSIVGVVGVAVDITERRRLEEQLRHSQKLESVGLLAGGIAHDFNNMLTAITGYADLIRQQLPQGDPLLAEVAEISRAAEKAALLTYQLLAFSRKQILQPRRLDLNEVVTDVVRMLRRLIGENVAIVTRLGPELGGVSADAGQLVQVVLNLAVNARDAMPGGGTLTLQTGTVDLGEETATGAAEPVPRGSYVTLAVSDTGTGIPAEIRDRIFEPFFTTKPVGRGTGMGLPTVYGIVRQSGGHIAVDSTVGRGTTFTVYLPRLDAAAPAAGVPAERPLARGLETILLVEDEEVVRRLARRALEACGYQVLDAVDGAQALAIAGRPGQDLHLVITDVVMPRMNGREVVEEILARRPGVKILFMSGHTDDAGVLRGMAGDGARFLQKPFTMQALTQKVRDVLDAPA